MAKKPGYSWSALELFHGNEEGGVTGKGCPLAYKLIRLDKIPRGENDALVTGRVTHKIIADYLNRLIITGQVTDWEWAGKVGFTQAPEDVPEIWRRFFENFVLPPMEAPGVERKLAFNRAWEPVEFFAPDAYFRGVVDLAFRQDALAVVVDWKSNRAVPANLDKNLQLRIYGWGVKKALYPDAQEVLLRLHFLRYGADREILLTPEDLATVPAELEDKIAVIEAEKHFDPRPGSFCSWCGVQNFCPVMSKALVPVEILAPATREQAVKAATLLLAVESMGKVLKDRLKQYVQENGPVQVGDMIYGPVPSISYEMDAETVTTQLMDLGVPREVAWAALNISKTSIDSALSKGGYKGKRKGERTAIIKQVLASVPAKPKEEIKFHKQGEE